MKSPRLTVIRSEDSPKWAAYREHLKTCERCREAVNEADLCLEGLDLFLDSAATRALVAFAEKLPL